MKHLLLITVAVLGTVVPCHADKTIGTEIESKDQNKCEIKRSILQMAELELRDGKMTCDREKIDGVPRPEHPRPDQFRENWITLNGEWQFEIDDKGDGEVRGLTRGQELNGRILVPFCPESKLSGLGYGNTRELKHVWYRRHFEVPAAMRGQRLRIHFGAVDYHARVFINGRFAGEHAGCSAGFDFEITGLLVDGPNEVVVQVKDDQWSGLQPRGKQADGESRNVFYTRTTGIWQPVWLEAVGSSFVENIAITPDPDRSRVLLQAWINGRDPDLVVKAEAFADGRLVGSTHSKGPWLNHLVLDLSEKNLWHPGAPFLYDLRLTLSSGGRTLDTLQSYFGLRKMTIDGRRILINDRPVFQRLILDQGFYPDGIWTAPTDDELRRDIERAMACGFNGARLHQKVFEKRFLYWADKLGYLVWGESPNAGYDNRREGFADFMNEWTELQRRDRNHPSIIGWCPFNENSENPPEATELQQMVWNITKAIDPTRPALETSGWTHTLPRPEVRDAHDYTADPARLRQNWIDYYDRRPKFDNERLRQITSREAAYEKGAPMAPLPVVNTLDAEWRVLVGASQDGEFCAPYRYRTEGKPADGWMNDGFDDGGWKSGLPPFANDSEKRTEWTSDEIFCRRTFEFDGCQLSHAAIVLNSNGRADIWLNGKLILTAGGAHGHRMHMLTGALRETLRKGSNTLAVHARKERPNQRLDLAILVDIDSNNSK